jgi:transposase InsO family protein
LDQDVDTPDSSDPEGTSADHHAGRSANRPRIEAKASYRRFQAAMPNECWQSDFTHYRLANGTPGDPLSGTEVEIITWLDDCTRLALHVSAHARVNAPIVLATFRSVRDLTDAIRRSIDGWNERCQPFAWTKTADQILPHATGGQRSSITRH